MVRLFDSDDVTETPIYDSMMGNEICMCHGHHDVYGYEYSARDEKEKRSLLQKL